MSIDLNFPETVLVKYIAGHTRASVLGDGLAGFRCLIDNVLYPDRAQALAATNAALRLIGGAYAPNANRDLTVDEARNLFEAL